MKNLLFFLWVCLFPIIHSGVEWLEYQYSASIKKKMDDPQHDTYGETLIMIVFFVFIGWLLYEK